jgi:hypothetical protein
MHTIRLREPWQASWDDGRAAAVDANPSAEHASTRWACYRRKFNCPTGLNADQSVSLEFRCREAIVGLMVQLNGHPLVLESESPTVLSAHVDATLAGHNQLEIHIPIDCMAQGNSGECAKLDAYMEVQLVIRG